MSGNSPYDPTQRPYASPAPHFGGPMNAYGAFGAPPQKHSGPGIASFVLAMVGAVIFVVLIVVAGALPDEMSSGINEDANATETAIGLGILGSCGLLMLGLVLGLVGMLLPDRKKLFAILGFAICSLMLLCTGGVMVLGFIALAAGGNP